jgi:uncharacterized CHY-type Zn-finger protein
LEVFVCSVCDEEVFREDLYDEITCIRCIEEWEQEKREMEREYFRDVMP